MLAYMGACIHPISPEGNLAKLPLLSLPAFPLYCSISWSIHIVQIYMRTKKFLAVLFIMAKKKKNRTSENILHEENVLLHYPWNWICWWQKDKPDTDVIFSLRYFNFIKNVSKCKWSSMDKRIKKINAVYADNGLICLCFLRQSFSM